MKNNYNINYILISIIITTCLLIVIFMSKNNINKPILIKNDQNPRILGDVICTISGLKDSSTFPVIVLNNMLLICKNHKAKEVLLSYDLPGEYYSYYYVKDHYERSIEIHYLILTCKTKYNNEFLALKLYTKENTIFSDIIEINIGNYKIDRAIAITHKTNTSAYFIFQSSDLHNIYLFDNDGHFVKEINFLAKTRLGSFYEAFSSVDPQLTFIALSNKYFSFYSIINLELSLISKFNLDIQFNLDDLIIENKAYNSKYPYTFAVNDKIVVCYGDKDKPYSVIEGIKGITQKVSDSYYATSFGIIKIPSIEDNCKYLLVSDIPKKDYTVFDYSMYLAEVGPLVSYTLDNKNFATIYYEEKYSDTMIYSYTFEFAERIESIADTVGNIYFYSESNVYELNKKDLFEKYKDNKGVIFAKKVF